MNKARALTAAALIGITLTACGGVDREGTRDNFVKELEAVGGEVDADCVDAALDEFDDDALQAIDDTLQAGESTTDSDALMADLFTCITTPG